MLRASPLRGAGGTGRGRAFMGTGSPGVNGTNPNGGGDYPVKWPTVQARLPGLRATVQPLPHQGRAPLDHGAGPFGLVPGCPGHIALSWRPEDDPTMRMWRSSLLVRVS